MKILPKSQRESHRYISFEIKSEKDVGYKAFCQEFQRQLTNLVGVIGAAHIRAVVVQDVYAFPHGVIQTNTKGVDVVKATFTQIQTIQNTPVSVQSTKASGVIHKVK